MVDRLQVEFHYLEERRYSEWRVLESHIQEVEDVLNLLKEIDRSWTYSNASQDLRFKEELKVFREAIRVMEEIAALMHDRVAKQSSTLSSVLGIHGLLKRASQHLGWVAPVAADTYKRQRLVWSERFLVVVFLLLLVALLFLPADTFGWITVGFVAALVPAYLVGRESQ
jgi:hypothetical protein